MYCLTCKSETKNPKFCSRSCSAIYNNSLGIYNRRKPEGRCKECGKSISSSRRYCSEHKFNYKNNNYQKVKKWYLNEWRGGSDLGLSKIIRDHLLELNNYKCQRCGFNTLHPDDNKTILEINHIDGNGLNHSPDNLEVLCPNCHALTSTYRARNLGNGRPVSYIRRISK
jgi:5-methylcytosine-specific restriction endonuclease McrA